MDVRLIQNGQKDYGRYRKIKILHVDDELNQLDFAQSFLGFCDPGIQVESVSSPEKALTMLKSGGGFDCVVSDYQMPGMDGIELARKMRLKSDIPIIIYTGRGSEEVAEAAFEAGVDDYIRKELNPSHYKVLAKRIRSAVEKYKVERELLQSEERYRTLVEGSPNAITVTVGEKIVYVNKKMVRLTNHSDESELIGKDRAQLISPGDMARLKRLSPRKRRRRRAPSVAEYKLLKKNGGEIDVVDHVSRVDWQGEHALLHIYNDVTDYKKKEESLKTSEEKYKSLFSFSPNPIAITDLDGNVTALNDAALIKTGYRRYEIVGKHVSDIPIFGLGDKQRYLDNFRSLLRGEIPKPFEVSLQTKDGSFGVAEVHLGLIEISKKRVGVQVIFLDITKRKKIEEELKYSLDTFRSFVDEIKDLEDELKKIFDNSLDTKFFRNDLAILKLFNSGIMDGAEEKGLNTSEFQREELVTGDT